MSAKRKESQNTDVVRKLSLKPENKVCMDCTQKGTPYVVMEYGTFVCTQCAGVHRSFQKHAKGISMTIFKDNEVKILRAGGNKKAEMLWRAKWDPKTSPKPSPNDERAVKNFIRKTYLDKKWKRSDSDEAPSHDEEPPTKPLTDIIPEPPKLEVEAKKKKRKKSKKGKKETKSETPSTNQDNSEFISFEPAQQQTKATQGQGNGTNGDFDTFFENDEGFANFDEMESQPKGGKRNDDLLNHLFDGLDMSGNPPAPQQPYGYPPQGGYPGYTGYPPQGGGYPAGYPAQPQYQGYPQPNPNFPQGAPPQYAYPPNTFPQSGYPPQQPSPFANVSTGVDNQWRGPPSARSTASSNSQPAPQPKKQEPDPFASLLDGGFSSVASSNGSARSTPQSSYQPSKPAAVQQLPSSGGWADEPFGDFSSNTAPGIKAQQPQPGQDDFDPFDF